MKFALEQVLERGNPILLFFFGFPCALFYSTSIFLIGLIKPDYPPLKKLILVGMILAIIIAIISFLIGIYSLIEVLSLSNRYSTIEWRFGFVFWDGLLGGTVTTLFFFLILRIWP
ncbi:MAG: hypothetical protein ACFFC6_13470 [Promethearchaeota archaeon]